MMILSQEVAAFDVGMFYREPFAKLCSEKISKYELFLTSLLLRTLFKRE